MVQPPTPVDGTTTSFFFSLFSYSTTSTTLLTLTAMLLVLGAFCYVLYPALEASQRNTVVAPHQSQSLHPPPNKDNNNDKPVLLSLVIPAYNEEERLETMLDAAHAYLSAPTCPGLDVLMEAYHRQQQNRDSSNGGSSVDNQARRRGIGTMTMVEWIVVNDGSKDQTSQVYESYVMKQKNKSTAVTMAWRLCTLSKNSGKGAAVQAGMLQARGQYRLMVDADGATEFGPGLEAVAQHIHNHNFVFGSRAVQAKDGIDKKDEPAVQRSLIRQIMQAGFHAFVVLVVGYSNVQDTQCGFKLFEGPTAQALFRGLHLHRWAFDTELFVRARFLNVTLKEVHVPWQEIEGSKLNTSTLNLIRVAIGMLRDMICVRLCYTLRIWTIDDDDGSNQDTQKKER